MKPSTYLKAGFAAMVMAGASFAYAGSVAIAVSTPLPIVAASVPLYTAVPLYPPPAVIVATPVYVAPVYAAPRPVVTVGYRAGYGGGYYVAPRGVVVVR